MSMPPSPIVACPRHPLVETALTCGRCGTPICPSCLVHTPGGIRCPDCAKMRALPMYSVGAGHVLRAAAAGLALAFPLGFLGALLLPPTARGSFFALFFALLMGMGAGSVVGEAVTRASGGKRGPAMIAVAVASIGLAAVVRIVLSGVPWEFALRDLAGLVIVGFAVVAASGRLR